MTSNRYYYIYELYILDIAVTCYLFLVCSCDSSLRYRLAIQYYIPLGCYNCMARNVSKHMFLSVFVCFALLCKMFLCVLFICLFCFLFTL